MVMQAQPVYDAWKSVQKDGERIRTVYVTPQGRTFTQEIAREMAGEEELIFLCGHYEGVDERVLEEKFPVKTQLTYDKAGQSGGAPDRAFLI